MLLKIEHVSRCFANLAAKGTPLTLRKRRLEKQDVKSHTFTIGGLRGTLLTLEPNEGEVHNVKGLPGEKVISQTYVNGRMVANQNPLTTSHLPYSNITS